MKNGQQYSTQTSTWKLAGEHTENGKNNLHLEKMMFSVWWNYKGIIYFVPCQTINSHKYRQQLDNLKY